MLISVIGGDSGIYEPYCNGEFRFFLFLHFDPMLENIVYVGLGHPLWGTIVELVKMIVIVG